jgi:hypothetical protein
MSPEHRNVGTGSHTHCALKHMKKITVLYAHTHTQRHTQRLTAAQTT